MINEKAVVEAFGKIKDEFLELRREISDLKEQIKNLESGLTQEEVPIETGKKLDEDELDLADSYY
jgi:hypothetical protein